MNLKSRVKALEEKRINEESFMPGLVYISAYESLEDAKRKYKQQHGFEFDSEKSALVEIVACDMSLEGNGRPLTAEELSSLNND